MFVFLMPKPKPPDRLGDAEGITAGSGMVDGLGETDLLGLGPACDPKDDLLLCEVGGGFMGRAKDCGVPGAEGRGDPTASENASAMKDVLDGCPGLVVPDLFEDILLPGKSIFVTLLCWLSENCPSFVVQRVDVDGSIRRLRCNIFVEWIPRHALNVVVVFCDLSDSLT